MRFRRDAAQVLHGGLIWLHSNLAVYYKRMIVPGLLASDLSRHTLYMEQAAEHNRQILDQFTRQAKPFALAPAHSTEQSLRVLLEAVAVNAEDVALDVACGPGIIVCALAETASHVTGVDLVPAMLKQAEQRQVEKGLKNVNWQSGDATKLPFESESFSLVVTRYSFHHLLEPAETLREMARVCRRGGRIAVADVTPEPEKRDAFDQMDRLRDPSHTRALTLAELQILGTEQGLNLLRVAEYRLDTALDALLANSFPLEGNAERMRTMVRKDIGVNALSIEAYLHNGAVHFTFPVSVAVWQKP
jgi:ubiquinone/menaquinone biosynthesis C-methylase UbiE